MASKRTTISTATPRKRPTIRRRGTVKKGESENSLWREWTSIFSCGTEWDEQRKLASVGQREIAWDYSHLLKELQSGILDKAADEKKFVHLFGATERTLWVKGVPIVGGIQRFGEGGRKDRAYPMISTAQTLAWHEEGKEPVERLTYIPVIVAIVGDKEAPAELGVNSVQMEHEKEGIYGFSTFKMSWAPFIYEDTEDYDPMHHGSSHIFRLHCGQRLASVKNMKETDAKRFEYCMPFIFNPKMQEDVQVETEVQVITKFPNVAYAMICQFDWKFDELEEFVPAVLKRESIEDTPENRSLLETRIREDVNAAKQRIRDEKAARKKRLESMTEEDKKALEGMRLYKFYPCGPLEHLPDLPHLMSSYINRYYGRAHEIFPPKPAPKPQTFWE